MTLYKITVYFFLWLLVDDFDVDDFTDACESERFSLCFTLPSVFVSGFFVDTDTDSFSERALAECDVPSWTDSAEADGASFRSIVRIDSIALFNSSSKLWHRSSACWARSSADLKVKYKL
jgi:hypothetical protein